MATFFSPLAFSLLLQLLLLAILPNLTTIFASKPLSFSIDLFHRDSSLSPIYDPSSTLAQRAEKEAPPSMLRSCSIASRFSNTTSVISSPVMAGPGEFLVKLSLGTPSSLYWAIIDAGSNLIWTTCCHCDNCHVKTPMFDPLQSSTYKNRRCSTSFCTELHDHRCTSDQLFCFRYSYRPNSEVEGVLASEMLLFDNGADTIKHEGIVFGSVHREDNPDSALRKVPGLGRGPPSLVKQIGSSIDDKFAYCLPPYRNENNSAGQLKFGEDAPFSGTEDVQETPMASDGGEGSFYVLILTNISVGNSRLDIQFGGAQTTALLGDARSIIIDSGTSLTFLAKDVYVQAANVINHERFYPLEQDLLCYHVENNGDPYEGLPGMTFHFANADWKLPPSNIFAMFRSGIACLAIKDGEMPVFGNIAQQNMHVKYDLGNRLLSFAPTECTQG
uniref:Peptidase A1 domain-containing protein n=3 Tax=Nymphaea colorata TaxID=210225 RepID=A0A5K0ZFA4_9MAGN